MALSEVIVRRGGRGAAALAPDDVSTRFEAVISEARPGQRADHRPVSKRQMRDKVGDTAGVQHAAGVRRVLRRGRRPDPSCRASSVPLRERRRSRSRRLQRHRPHLDTAEGPAPGTTRSPCPPRSRPAPTETITVKLNGNVLATGVATDATSAKAIIDSAGYGTAAIGAGSWATLAALTDRDARRRRRRPREHQRRPRHHLAARVLRRARSRLRLRFRVDVGPDPHGARAAAASRLRGTGYNRFARCDLPDTRHGRDADHAGENDPGARRLEVRAAPRRLRHHHRLRRHRHRPAIRSPRRP